MNQWKLRFTLIWSGQAISFFTSAILQMALIWHLAIVTNSALIMSVASIAGFLPMALLGSFAGALVDRWSRKLTMIGADLFIAVVSSALVIYTLFAELPLWLVIVVLFVRSIGTSFHSPAISAVTPLIVPESHLTKCAGYTQTVQTSGYIAGTAVAAVLYPLWGVTGMVILDVVGAVLASISVAAVKIPKPKKTESKAVHEHKQGLFFEVKQGLKIFKGSKGLYSLLWIGAAFSIMFSPVNALFPLMSMDYFKGTTLHASIVEITFSAGMMIGGIILGLWGGFKNRAVTMTVSVALIGIAVGITGILSTSGFIIFAVLSLLIGFGAPFYIGTQTALMQERIAPEYMGRVFGLYGSIASFAMLAGLIITGALADMTGINVWFLIAGVMMCMLAALMLLIPSVRNIEHENREGNQ